MKYYLYIIFILISHLAISEPKINDYNVNIIVFKHENIEIKEASSIVPVVNNDFNVFTKIDNYQLLKIIDKFAPENMLFANKFIFNNKNQMVYLDNNLVSPSFYGNINIELNRFFTLEFSLNVNYNSLNIPIHQKIRTKSKQLVYIDNPIIGVLLYIEPIFT